MRTCLIIPFSGPLPIWMPLFLRSVELNPWVHVFLISNREFGPLPVNVTHLSWSLSEIERRVRKYIDPALTVPHAYKLCDLKPFYALLFPDLIEDYKFWGYCDMDLVFGSLHELLSSERLAEVDVFFADACLATGHFALYRNHPVINSVAKRIPDYLKQLSMVAAAELDEIGMMKVMIASPDIRWSMAQKLCESQLTLTAQGQMMGRTSGVLGHRHKGFWRAGHSFIESPEHGPQEVLYLHFMGLKRSYHWKYYDPRERYEEFSFSAAGFLPWISAPNSWTQLRSAVRGGALSTLSAARGMAARAMPNEFRLLAKEFLRQRAS